MSTAWRHDLDLDDPRSDLAVAVREADPPRLAHIALAKGKAVCGARIRDKGKHSGQQECAVCLDLVLHGRWAIR